MHMEVLMSCTIVFSVFVREKLEARRPAITKYMGKRCRRTRLVPPCLAGYVRAAAAPTSRRHITCWPANVFFHFTPSGRCRSRAPALVYGICTLPVDRLLVLYSS